MNLRNSVTVRVPATTANLGPGFDCLGMALNIHNTVTIAKSHSFNIAITGEGEKILSRGKDNLVYKAITKLFDKVKQPVPDLEINCHNEIPTARGLGSSTAAIVAGLVAANSLLGNTMSKEELLQLGIEMEGHPDNLTPALFGGCQVVVMDDTRLVHERISVQRSWKFVLFIPDFEIPTAEARTILPHQITREDAIYNLGRVALLTNALITGRADILKVATQDRLHQPHRQTLFPAMSHIFAAALSAGADGVFLSGSGPTILALARVELDTIGKAMLAEGKKAGIKGKIKIAELSETGALIT